MHDEELFTTVEREFTTTLLRARQTLMQRAKAIHPELQAPGYRILAILVHHDSQQQGFLAESLQLDKATISRLVKQLETQGLITRAADPKDGRAQLVSITERARDAWYASGQAQRQRLRDKLEDWSTEDVQRFADLLHRLNDNSDAADAG